MFVLRFLSQVWNWVTWGQKLSHQAKSKENLVNTPEVTLFKQSSWILPKMSVLMISRSSLKLGHLIWETRSPGQIKGKPCWHSRGHILKWSSWILLKMFVLMISRWCIFSLYSDFLKFFHLGQFLSNYWSYRVIIGTREVFVFRSVSQYYSSYSQWYLVHAYILAWPFECSHPYLTLTCISQSMRHATLSYLLV